MAFVFLSQSSIFSTAIDRLASNPTYRGRRRRLYDFIQRLLSCREDHRGTWANIFHFFPSIPEEERDKRTRILVNYTLKEKSTIRVKEQMWMYPLCKDARV